MTETPSDAARKVADRIYATDFARVEYLWERMTGQPLSHRRELIRWLCEVHRLEKSQAENLTFDEIAAYLRPDPNSLDKYDQAILEVMPIGVRMTEPEIRLELERLLPPDDRKKSDSCRRKRLSRLVKGGWLHRPEGQGYIRKV